MFFCTREGDGHVTETESTNNFRSQPLWPRRVAIVVRRRFFAPLPRPRPGESFTSRPEIESKRGVTGDQRSCLAVRCTRVVRARRVRRTEGGGGSHASRTPNDGSSRSSTRSLKLCFLCVGGRRGGLAEFSAKKARRRRRAFLQPTTIMYEHCSGMFFSHAWRWRALLFLHIKTTLF